MGIRHKVCIVFFHVMLGNIIKKLLMMSCFSLKTRHFIFCVTAAIFSVEVSQTSLKSYGKERKNKMSTTLLKS